MDRMALAMEQMAEFMMAQQAQNQNQGQPQVDFAKAVASRQPPYYAGEKDPWATVGPDLLQDPDISWEEFKEELRGQFYTERIKGIKCKEFLRLKQKGATVQDYYDQYVELMRFAQDIVPDEASKARRFVRGLGWDVRRAIAPFMCSTLKEAYDRASDHYQVYLDQQEVYSRNKRKADDKQGKFRSENKKSNQGESNPKQGEKRGGTNQEKRSVCRRCGRDHPGENCQGIKIKCFKCGLTGHKYYECRTRVENFRDHSQNTSQGGGFNESTGQKPTEAGNKGASFQQGNHGRLVNAAPGPNQKGKSPMGESSRENRGRIYIVNSTQAQASNVVIAGFNYPGNLIRFDLEGIDVVLGMDWLDRYEAQIKLRKYVHKGCEVYLYLVQDDEIGEPEINRIPVVCEFPDVFPYDLTEMPPEREVEQEVKLYYLSATPILFEEIKQAQGEDDWVKSIKEKMVDGKHGPFELHPNGSEWLLMKHCMDGNVKVLYVGVTKVILSFLDLSTYKRLLRQSRIGNLAYRLALPIELDRVHNVFHVSQLKRYVPDASHVLEPEELEMDDSLAYEERPIRVLDSKTQDTRRKSVRMIKVQWSNHSPEEATWELEDVMMERYPELFNSGA
ncbi:uncharacterized protein LOC116001301 [Ipomoea triloba]|uniref:uncharacterized protein LOC116001301 n=1 Tax=Ipomoea triloba TaxID=35885 RepID=UPI00125E7DD0|nr:uncharacterized protein LOC116001301 [Ipomoea triloba]